MDQAHQAIFAFGNPMMAPHQMPDEWTGLQSIAFLKGPNGALTKFQIERGHTASSRNIQSVDHNRHVLDFYY